MATISETEKQMLFQNTFRRSSLTDHGVQKLETDRIPTILGQMGQPYDSKKLQKFIKQLDPKDTGYIDREGYMKICKEFIKNAAALAKAEGDEFSFKHLIGLNDFAHP